MIAQVIVDVAVKQTDRIFEYHIPTELEKKHSDWFEGSSTFWQKKGTRLCCRFN